MTDIRNALNNFKTRYGVTLERHSHKMNPATAEDLKAMAEKAKAEAAAIVKAQVEAERNAIGDAIRERCTSLLATFIQKKATVIAKFNPSISAEESDKLHNLYNQLLEAIASAERTLAWVDAAFAAVANDDEEAASHLGFKLDGRWSPNPDSFDDALISVQSDDAQFFERLENLDLDLV